MIEKVNPCHPDKIADRIAGALVDLCYSINDRPKCAFEVLIGHGDCFIVGECSVELRLDAVKSIVSRIAGPGYNVFYNVVAQDASLARNQRGLIRCGDNGIFRGVPLTQEEQRLSRLARRIFSRWPTDGKYILDNTRLIICQSHAKTEDVRALFKYAEINPLGDWCGSPSVDTGATNRKLGSDLASSVTGGGLHGKDLSKADVSLTIYCFLKAQMSGKVCACSCAIGDEVVMGKPYSEIVDYVKEYIQMLGGFEKLAEWGLF